MPAPFEISFNAAEVAQFQAAMERLAAAGRDLGPAMQDISETLMDETERRFAAAGPGWPAWSPAYAKKRQGGAMLHDTGRLAGSVSTDFGPSFARIGAATVYAAIHQLGGDIEHAARSQRATFKVDLKTGRSRFASHKKGNFQQWVTIGAHTSHMPARPYLPFDESGLFPDAEEAVLDTVLEYLAKALG